MNKYLDNPPISQIWAAILTWLMVVPAASALTTEPQTSEGPKTPVPLSPVTLFSRMGPAVVKLVVKGEQGDIIGTGSGFVVRVPSESTRHILTNYHVIRAANYVKVEFQDDSLGISETVIAEDPPLDLAILLVRPAKEGKTLPKALIEVSSADEPPVGTRLYAIGSPRGMKNTLSDGLLSGYRSEGRDVERVQITNPISPGSSGGPVFTESGAFVGVTTESLRDAQNVNFAIPAKKVQQLLTQEKNARPLWKGSCIFCEESDALLAIYNDLYERFRQEPGNSDCRAASAVDADMWASGSLINDCSKKFNAICESEAEANNYRAMLLIACFGESDSIKSNQVERHRKAIDLLEKVLPHSADQKYFVLLKLGKRQLGLVSELEKTEGPHSAKKDLLLATASRTFELSLEQRPDFAPTLDRLHTTKILSRRLDDALKVSEKLIRVVPNSFQAHARRAETLRLLGSKLAAIEEQRIAWSLNPYDVLAAINLGDLYSATGQYEKAIEAYRGGLEGDEIRFAANLRDAEVQASAGEEGGEELAEAMIVWAQTLHGNFAWQLHCSIARSFVALKRYHEAIESYNRAIECAAQGAGQENIQMLRNELAICQSAVTQTR